MALISIKLLVEAAKSRGFTVRNFNGDYAEIYAPDHKGPKTVWNFDSQYSTADFVLNARGAIGYGYNSFFYGPWHTGMVKPEDAQGLLSHPAMHGAV